MDDPRIAARNEIFFNTLTDLKLQDITKLLRKRWRENDFEQKRREILNCNTIQFRNPNLNNLLNNLSSKDINELISFLNQSLQFNIINCNHFCEVLKKIFVHGRSLLSMSDEKQKNDFINCLFSILSNNN